MIPTLFVRSTSKAICWICGSLFKPSREHKFKASDLRRHFGKGKLHVATFEDDPSNFRVAQGLGSSHLKFESQICEKCNSAVMQESDRAYDQFIGQLERDDESARQLLEAFSAPVLPSGTKYHSVLPIFRYFAKILGCQMADAGAPIPKNLSQFVAKRTDKNCIWLGIRRDPTYDELSSLLGGENARYAAHGGLVVITKMPKLFPSRMYSTMTVGGIQFTFFLVLNSFHIWEMRIRFPEFVERCRVAALREINGAESSAALKRLGLERRKEK